MTYTELCRLINERSSALNIRTDAQVLEALLQFVEEMPHPYSDAEVVDGVIKILAEKALR